MRLQGKTALVTGAGSGYGAAMARRFAREGARVICADIDGDAAAKVAATLAGVPGTTLAVRCDVADGASVAAMIAEVVRAMGGFDVIVNNAALSQKPGRIAKIAEADLDRLLAVNVKSLFHMAVHGVPVLRRGGGGVVLPVDGGRLVG